MIRIRCFGSCVLRRVEREHWWIFGGSISSHPTSVYLYIASNIADAIAFRPPAQYISTFACRPISRLDLLASPHFFFDRRIFNYSITFLSFFSEKKRKKTRRLLTLYGFVGTIFNIPPQEGVIASLNASRPGSTRRETKESDEFSSLSSLGSLF